jgi:hypothetical protein
MGEAASPGVTGRARFITHRGKRIYLIDCTGLSPEQVLQVMPQVAREVRAEPPGSVLTLTHIKDVRLDSRVNADLKELAAGNKPFVKGAAVAGLSPLQMVILNMVKLFSRRDFRVFATMDEAKDYLASLG